MMKNPGCPVWIKACFDSCVLVFWAAIFSTSSVSAAAPLAPTNVAARLINGAINITWVDQATDESGYVIERAWDNQGFGVIGTVGSNTTSFSDFSYGVSSYTYRIKAWNDQGYSAAASADIAIVSTGGSVAVTANASPDSGTLPLSVAFTAITPSSDVTWWFGDGTSASGTAVVHTYNSVASGVDKMTTYAVSVRVRQPSLTGFGFDTGFYTVLVNVQLPSVAAPTNLVASLPAKATVRLTWTNAPSQADQIRVERRLAKNTVYSTIATLPGSSTTYTDSNVKSGTYYYRVVAVNTITGESAASLPVVVKPR